MGAVPDVVSFSFFIHHVAKNDNCAICYYCVGVSEHLTKHNSAFVMIILSKIMLLDIALFVHYISLLNYMATECSNM